MNDNVVKMPNRTLTTQLIPAANVALRETATRLGDSETNVMNVALQLYAFVTAQQVAGSQLAVINGDGTVSRLEITRGTERPDE